MSSVPVSVNTSQTESKSAKKKKAKAGASAQAPIVPEPEAANAPSTSDAMTNGTDAAYESPYIRELKKCVHLVDFLALHLAVILARCPKMLTFTPINTFQLSHNAQE